MIFLICDKCQIFYFLKAIINKLGKEQKQIFKFLCMAEFEFVFLDLDKFFQERRNRKTKEKTTRIWAAAATRSS